MQPTMKSWQLIAVVGDAFQVRRGKTALSAEERGDGERESTDGEKVVSAEAS